MNKQMSWGIAALIIVLIAAGGFMYWQWSSVQQLKEQLAEDEKLLEEMEKPVAENKPPVAREGFKMVQHGDHYHEVPIDAPDTQQDASHEPIMQPKTAVKPVVDASGEVIYPHHELLQTYPVAALRAQARDSGHWSAPYIPPFPQDDVEANELARNRYLYNYYVSIGDYYNPVAKEALKVIRQWRIDNRVYELIRTDRPPRFHDLRKLVTWTGLDSPGGSLELDWPTNFTKEDYENANNQ